MSRLAEFFFGRPTCTSDQSSKPDLLPLIQNNDTPEGLYIDYGVRKAGDRIYRYSMGQPSVVNGEIIPPLEVGIHSDDMFVYLNSDGKIIKTFPANNPPEGFISLDSGRRPLEEYNIPPSKKEGYDSHHFRVLGYRGTSFTANKDLSIER